MKPAITIFNPTAFPLEHTHSLQNSMTSWVVLKQPLHHQHLYSRNSLAFKICMTVDNLLLLPCKQDLAKEQHQKWFNELLDGSLRLLDVCEFARDALLQTKECTREFQSTLCRRHGSKMELTREIEKYLASRKVVKRATQKALKSMQTKLYS